MTHNPSYNAFDSFRKHQVKATSIEDFLARYYKSGRYTGRGKEYAGALLASFQEEYDRCGFCFIDRHGSVTGEIVAFYGAEWVQSSLEIE